MFDDPKKELKRLEQELLAEEDDNWLDDQLAQAHELLGDVSASEDMDATRIYRDPSEMPIRNYANGYTVPRRMYDYEDQYVDEPQEDLSDEPHEKGIGGLIVLALFEMLAIAIVLVYWMGQIL